MRVDPGLSREERDRTSDREWASAMLDAVRDDMRETLRTAWLDPCFDTLSTYPVFLTAAWSAIRPNVGRRFHLLARGLRERARRAVDSFGDPSDLRSALRGPTGSPRPRARRT
jgi:hypothetical protein